mgnify:CR=1 FL=1
MSQTREDRFWAKTVGRDDGCIIWTAANDGSYGLFNAGGTKKAHRVSYEMAHGAIPQGMCVRHKCDVRLCVNPAHLEVGTFKDNARDRTERGRWAQVMPRGEKQGQSKLTDAVVRALRRTWATGGFDRKCLASAFNISLTTVCRVINRTSWSHIL